MGQIEENHKSKESWVIPSPNEKKEFVVSGHMVSSRDKSSGSKQYVMAPHNEAPVASRQVVGKDGKLLGFPILRAADHIEQYSGMLQPPEILTLEELAKRGAVEGLDYNTVMNTLTDLGPDGRLLLYFRNGELVRHEVFEEPRICKDISRGAVVHNLEQKPPDVSGWRVHEFVIDQKGCLGEICTRCARVCPEAAIHLRGVGADSFCEIDPTACKGCFICWVECSRKAADCILVDGKVFISDLRAAHFGQ